MPTVARQPPLWHEEGTLLFSTKHQVCRWLQGQCHPLHFAFGIDKSCFQLTQSWLAHGLLCALQHPRIRRVHTTLVTFCNGKLPWTPKFLISFSFLPCLPPIGTHVLMWLYIALAVMCFCVGIWAATLGVIIIICWFLCFPLLDRPFVSWFIFLLSISRECLLAC